MIETRSIERPRVQCSVPVCRQNMHTSGYNAVLSLVTRDLVLPATDLETLYTYSHRRQEL